jgi:Zn-dependent protease
MFIFGGRMVNQVPINSYNFKNGTRSYALVAISGPIGNLILSLVCFYMISIAGYFNLQPYMINTISTFCIFTAQVSAFFATIEMIPIPPLDGFKVFEYFYPSKANSWSDFLGPWSLPLVFVVIFAPGFNDLLWTIIRILLTVIRFFVFI